MKYYDKESPEINIKENIDLKDDGIENLRYINGSFPTKLKVKNLDDTMLSLHEVARNSNPRNAFIYFYQIIEYASFYHFDEKSKKLLMRIIRDPNFIECPDDRMREFYHALVENMNSDDSKMRKLIEECCDPKQIWNEINNDKLFFAEKIIFDGGFEFNPLLTNEINESTWCTMWHPKLIDSLTKVRNCLVHAREKRESKIILPTRQNNLKIKRLIPIISRIAEQVILYNID